MIFSESLFCGKSVNDRICICVVLVVETPNYSPARNADLDSGSKYSFGYHVDNIL